MESKNKPALLGKGQTGSEKHHDQNYSKPRTKREVVLAWLIDQSVKGEIVTRFDAERIGDHCLNTTISEIDRIDGVRVRRSPTKRPTRFGKPTDCHEYWISMDDIGLAKRVLSAKRTMRAA